MSWKLGQELCFVQAMESAREAVPNLPQGYSGEIVEVYHPVVADVSGEMVEGAGSVEAWQGPFRVRTSER